MRFSSVRLASRLTRDLVQREPLRRENRCHACLSSCRGVDTAAGIDLDQEASFPVCHSPPMTVSADLYVHGFLSFATQAETWLVQRGGLVGSVILAVCGCEGDALRRAREIADHDRSHGHYSRIHLQSASKDGWRVVQE